MSHHLALTLPPLCPNLALIWPPPMTQPLPLPQPSSFITIEPSPSMIRGKQSCVTTKPPSIVTPFQPRDHNYVFPLRSFRNGKVTKRFNRNWFSNDDWMSWIHYDSEIDVVFVQPAIMQPDRTSLLFKTRSNCLCHRVIPIRLTQGQKHRGFDQHCKSESHKEAHERLISVQKWVSGHFITIYQHFNDEKSTNRQNLLTILANVRFLVRQALPLKGGGSNFTQLYLLRENDNPALKMWNTLKKINKYVHCTIQNEMMQHMALRTLRKVSKNLQNSELACVWI